MAITAFVIWQLLCLVRDGFLWLEEPIPFTADLIHRITHLPLKGDDPANTTGTSSEVGLPETMKRRYKLVKGKREYVIASINGRDVQVAT